MKHLLLILKKIYVWIIFIVVEVISLSIYFGSDTYMLSKCLFVREKITMAVDSSIERIASYFNLDEENRRLVEMNARLISENESFRKRLSSLSLNPDSLWTPTVTALNVVKCQTLYDNNFIVMDGGQTAGVVPGMAVVTNSGVVGFISNVSDNFSVAISILSKEKFKSSAKLSGTSFTGSLFWNGKNVNVVQMSEISSHANINIGDTVLTTSYSNIFVENIPIGKVSAFHVTDADFYEADVETFVDFTNLDYVYTLELKGKEERDSLEVASGLQERLKR